MRTDFKHSSVGRLKRAAFALQKTWVNPWVRQDGKHGFVTWLVLFYRWPKLDSFTPRGRIVQIQRSVSSVWKSWKDGNLRMTLSESVSTIALESWESLCLCNLIEQDSALKSGVCDLLNVISSLVIMYILICCGCLALSGKSTRHILLPVILCCWRRLWIVWQWRSSWSFRKRDRSLSS